MKQIAVVMHLEGDQEKLNKTFAFFHTRLMKQKLEHLCTEMEMSTLMWKQNSEKKHQGNWGLDGLQLRLQRK